MNSSENWREAKIWQIFFPCFLSYRWDTIIIKFNVLHKHLHLCPLKKRFFFKFQFGPNEKICFYFVLKQHLYGNQCQRKFNLPTRSEWLNISCKVILYFRTKVSTCCCWFAKCQIQNCEKKLFLKQNSDFECITINSLNNNNNNVKYKTRVA